MAQDANDTWGDRTVSDAASTAKYEAMLADRFRAGLPMSKTDKRDAKAIIAREDAARSAAEAR